MKQKITSLIFLRRMLLILGVLISFAAFIACSDKGEGATTTPTPSDIYAADVNVVYDGRPHSITVGNTIPTDIVLYSTDGKKFSGTSPAFVLPDTYTVFFKVIRSGYADFSSSATVTITPSILDGISAPDVNVVYDGLSHSVSLNGTLTADKITYSTDGFDFSAEIPSFSEVGDYTVYYRVERIYGDYKSSCTLTILPDIFGRYFNPSFGLVVLSPDCAYVNSIRNEVAVATDGSGSIENTPFSVSDDCMLYNALSFTLLSDEQCVYKLNSDDLSTYFCSSTDGVLNISIKDNTGNIALDEKTLLSVPDVNYCESATVADYAKLTFTQAFSHASEITEVNVSFSLRDKNPFTAENLYITYDGQPHGFDFSIPAVYPDGTTPMFTDVGKHTVTALFLSDEYLPLFLDCSLIILPNINGTFFSSDRVFTFKGNSVYIDNEYSGELSVLDDSWIYNDLPITVTDDGIIYDNAEYTHARPIMIVYIDDIIIARLIIPTSLPQIGITFKESTLTFYCDDGTMLTGPLDCDSVSVLYNGEQLTPIITAFAVNFVLGTAELTDDIMIVNISTIM